MLPHLRVLIVEDSEDDTLLLVRELRRAGYNLHYVRVDTADGMEAALNQELWDIVIADYSLPAFSGLDALKVVQKRKLDLPFIIVSGTIGEDIAVGAMKAGAHDYLIKGNLTRLVPAVERELREAEERYKRHSAEQAFQESEDRFRTLCSSAPLAIFQTDAQGQGTYNNPLWYKISGLTEEESLGYNWIQAIHPEDRDGVVQDWHRAVSERNTWVQEYRLLTPQGDVRWVRALASPMYSADYRFLGHVGTVEDITDRKLAAQKIYEQAALLDISIDAIAVCDLENNILFWNKGAERLYGWTTAEVFGKNAAKLLLKSGETAPPFVDIQTILATEGKWQGELQQVTKDGKNIIVESRWTMMRDEAGNPKSILTLSTDITQKKQLEAQFLRAQRLESLGTLASGIAHDFNNILTPILATAQLLPIKLPNLDESTQQLLHILESSAKRGADLVQQILSFTRGVEGSRSIVQLRHLLLDVAQVTQRTFPKSIETKTDIIPTLWTVFADATQLHQVLMNLCVNARDAMPNGGTLYINAENLWLDKNYAASMHVDAKEGFYVVITIADTGTGIAPEIMDRIFDPFFTTKEIGKGTGLGLSTVMGIIKNHSGFITVYSEVGKGSSFKVYLPSREVSETNSVTETELPNGNGELILVVDDEVSICEIAKTTLESHNYRIITASDGIGALALYAQHMDEIKLVLMDMMMPVMDGASTILMLQRMNPQVQIIAMSGLMSYESPAQKRNLGIREFLAKPFTAQVLLNTLQKVLD
ncbi:PAS domain S-box protein [Tolypothrix sp. FACHB-123]|uniref:hybrid sensor histidine kinase/response regulator n=1 Tax=Tolypothrix sp. FACHB-123 TaxID=2692868 RepID=UPI00168725B8|nr:PAS domain S-box protein [Tolypothrix sp. FACHB-123]MBD2353100.1 PAS domain S-box protein [Tolypothrix sp. FACHB-123]